MGKGFNNYMSKKFFHPGSEANRKRVWIAEQKTETHKKKQEELRIQYEKEQDLYNNKALVWKDSQEKLAINFIYEAPPGVNKETTKHCLKKKEDTKFEWQRKSNAPLFTKPTRDFENSAGWSRGYEKELQFLKKLDTDERLRLLRGLKKMHKKEKSGSILRKKLKMCLK